MLPHIRLSLDHHYLGEGITAAPTPLGHRVRLGIEVSFGRGTLHARDASPLKTLTSSCCGSLDPCNECFCQEFLYRLCRKHREWQGCLTWSPASHATRHISCINIFPRLRVSFLGFRVRMKTLNAWMCRSFLSFGMCCRRQLGLGRTDPAALPWWLASLSQHASYLAGCTTDAGAVQRRPWQPDTKQPFGDCKTCKAYTASGVKAA